MKRRLAHHLGIALGVTALLLSACSSGEDSTDPGAEPATGVPTGDVQTDEGEPTSGGSTGAPGQGQLDISSLGAAPAAEPGTAVAVIDGITLTWQTAGSVNPQCDISADRVVVSMDAEDGGGRLSFQISLSEGRWNGSGAFEHPDRAHSDLSFFDAHVTVEDSVVTYQGAMVPRSEFGSDSADWLGSLTVSCGAAGEDPTATIGGATLTFPINGSQSVSCEFAEDRFQFQVNRLSIDGNQLTVEGRLDGDQWIGGISIIAGDDRYQAFIPADLDGMTVGAVGVEWSGTLTHTSQTDSNLEETVEGSVTFAC